MKTSIHIKPCNVHGSRAERERLADYWGKLTGYGRTFYREDLLHLNQHWVVDEAARDLPAILENQKKIYKEKTGQSMKLKDVEYKSKTGKVKTRRGTSPIREGVIVISPQTTMEELSNFAKIIEKEYGIKALAIDIHRDEGHYGLNDGKWRTNEHAHIVFDWFNYKTGKTFKLDAEDMKKWQTILAEELHMERGQESDVRHLDVLDFRHKAKIKEYDEYLVEKEKEYDKVINSQRQELLSLENENTKLKDENKLLEETNEGIKTSIKAKEAASAALEATKGIFGQSKKDKEIARLNLIVADKEKCIEEEKSEKELLTAKIDELQREKNGLANELATTKKELKKYEKWWSRACELPLIKWLQSLRFKFGQAFALAEGDAVTDATQPIGSGKTWCKSDNWQLKGADLFDCDGDEPRLFMTMNETDQDNQLDQNKGYAL